MTGRIISRRSSLYVPGTSHIKMKSTSDNANHVRSVTNFEPWHVPGTLLWLGNYSDSRATRNTQPTPADWDMERADTALWSPVRTTLSKVTGYSGLYALRLTPDGTGSQFGYQSGKTIPGNRYIASVWCRVESGAGIPGVGYAATYATGINTGTWHYISGELTEAANIVGVNCSNNATVVDFDDLTYENLSLASYSPAYTVSSYSGTAFAQATATIMPWVASNSRITYQGDRLTWSAASSSVKCLHDGTGGTLIVCVTPNALNAINVYCGTHAAPNQIGFLLGYTNANQFWVAIANGSGTHDINTFQGSVPVSIGNTYVFTFRIASGANGVTVRQNSTSRYTGSLTAPSSGDPTSQLTLGDMPGGGYPINGSIHDTLLTNRVLSDAECLRIERYMYKQATGTTPAW